MIDQTASDNSMLLAERVFALAVAKDGYPYLFLPNMGYLVESECDGWASGFKKPA